MPYLDMAPDCTCLVSCAVANLGTKSFRAPDPSFVDELIAAADKDGDGRINYEEFTKVMLEKAGPWGAME